MTKFGLKMRLGLIVVFFTLVNLSIGQARLSFSETSHDFGEIKEESGYAEVTFHFVNAGDQPIKSQM